MLWLKLLKFVTIHSWHVWICNVESVFAFQCGAHGTAVLFFVYIMLVVGFKNTHFFYYIAFRLYWLTWSTFELVHYFAL